MTQINPKYILRNYMVQVAINKAQQQDFSEIHTLIKIRQTPIDEHEDHAHYADPPPDWANNIQVSCSS